MDCVYFAADKNRYIGAVSLDFDSEGRRLRRKVSGKTKCSSQSSAAARPLRKLSTADVRSALSALSEQLSTRSLQIAYNCLVGAIRHAESDDLVGRNVAALVRPPAGHEGPPSKALSVEQGQHLLRADATERPGGDLHPLHAYVVLLLTTGLRPEEARTLRWDHIDLDAGTVAVWRSDRAGGDTKTPKSRRTLQLAQIAVDSLRQRKAAQAADRLKAGEVW